jgi:predicted cupin superfamily sugar epimerase/GNAT superfamily N-acetyltransferase
MIFREATINDIPAMHVVRMAVKENVLNNPDLVTETDYKNYLTTEGKGWLCEENGEVLGFAIIDTSGTNIWALFVSPGHERKNIGRTLHDTMLDWHFAQSDQSLWLSTAIDTRAEEFYKKAGWIITQLLKTRELKFEMTAELWKLQKEGSRSVEKNAAYYIKKLGLTKHVEGGSYKESYRSPMVLPNAAIGNIFKGDRNASTAIYFLLEHRQYSAMHRIAADEIWHFYEGDPLHIYEIHPGGRLFVHTLGRDIEKGQHHQCIIAAGSWFGSRCEVLGGFSLVGCTVAPGFDIEDFELADREKLSREYPAYEKIIRELT